MWCQVWNGGQSSIPTVMTIGCPSGGDERAYKSWFSRSIGSPIMCMLNSYANARKEPRRRFAVYMHHPRVRMRISRCVFCIPSKEWEYCEEVRPVILDAERSWYVHWIGSFTRSWVSSHDRFGKIKKKIKERPYVEKSMNQPPNAKQFARMRNFHLDVTRNSLRYVSWYFYFRIGLHLFVNGETFYFSHLPFAFL